MTKCWHAKAIRRGVIRMVSAVILFLVPAVSEGQETITYYTTDAIGSIRMVTDSGGAVVARYDYRPFGDPCGSACGPQGTLEKRQFAGKEKDLETSLDYFGARYYASQTGRFTTVDPVVPIEDALLDPQRWNRYTYVMNRPLALTDPDGRCPQCLLMLQRLAQVASQAASRYGTQAYNWATRFFNSPTGQEVTAAAAEAISGAQLPFGFGSAAQLHDFSRTLNTGLREVGGEGARAFLTGSAVTGVQYKTGGAFDVGRTSDFDIALVGSTLLAKAKELGVELRSKGTRTEPLMDPKMLRALGLDKLTQRLSQQAGRPVRFMIYESEEALRERGAPYIGF
jgi:RHS repeat-associated protein